MRRGPPRLKQPATPVPVKPPMVRRTSSTGRVITNMVNAVEMRYRSMREAFRAVDEDASGSLTRDELQRALFHWHVQAQARHIDGVLSDFDRDGDGSISYAEWCEGLKPFTVRSQPIFGLADQHTTDRYRVLPGGRRVLINDNLKPFEAPHGGQGAGRPDYELMELPRGKGPASPVVVREHTAALSDRIHTKFKMLKDAFRSFDENKDGRLSKQELLMAIRCFNLPIPIEHAVQIAELCDEDGDGLINYNEFASALKRKDAIGN